MHNWSVDEKRMKQHPEEYKLWKLEQLINFGMDGEKISLNEVKKNFDKLKVDPRKRRLLEHLIRNSK